jgi:hypothetical protein
MSLLPSKKEARGKTDGRAPIGYWLAPRRRVKNVDSIPETQVKCNDDFPWSTWHRIVRQSALCRVFRQVQHSSTSRPFPVSPFPAPECPFYLPILEFVVSWLPKNECARKRDNKPQQTKRGKIHILHLSRPLHCELSSIRLSKAQLIVKH